ncbi:nitrate reductase molybdenum cofactor assembly chaperone [Tahibacter amnicola]|uniref:Nitrate reductase molybdenum cofactor assembly chaperone n=1 Tax=Tahibacter amnicola TaxID=2976241 RepID=A0ABY6BL49_9GAMM|nr:nitrate reductase molybdenum cofactor assembly chaperone [Tahibacter amnicola]UXI70494.1 nitrate reductase molybdenum cofactor assembly chaperone [Tahibacter amnicola]
MNLLKLISVLLEYPDPTLWENADALREVVRTVPPDGTRRDDLAHFVDTLLELDPMDAQERWLACFDRGRAMSLLLFEHIHGESRDRGQAMVDLMETYRRSGFEIDSRELPDYLPLLLEYLSLRPDEEKTDWLRHTGHILELLAARAAERESPYALLFTMLVEAGGGTVELSAIRRRVRDESRDDTAEVMDRVWEEEAVRFGATAPDSSCAPARRVPEGIRPAGQGNTP